MKRAAERGLTLIEVLVAIAIFAIVSVAVLAMFPTIFKLNSQVRSDQAVTIAAKQFMENTRTTYTSNTSFQQGTDGLPAAPTPGNGYTCTRSASSQLNSTVTPSEVLIQRVTLLCQRTGQPSYTFVLDLGKPS